VVRKRNADITRIYPWMINYDGNPEGPRYMVQYVSNGAQDLSPVVYRMQYAVEFTNRIKQVIEDGFGDPCDGDG